MSAEHVPGSAVTHPAAGLFHRVGAAVAEFFLLSGPRATVRGRSPAVGASLRTWWLAARAYLRVAEQLSPETEFAPALALYREGIRPLVGAVLVVTERAVLPADVVDVGAAWATLERNWSRLGIEVDLREFGAAKRALVEAAPFDDPPPGKEEAAAVLAALSRLVDLVGRAIEPRTERRLAAYARARQAVVAVVVVVAIAIPVKRALAPRDLALYKPVTMSTVHPWREAVGGTNLTNGKIEFGWATATDNTADGGRQDPWITVDLQKPTRIGKIVVYNRGDERFNDCLPLILEIGLNPNDMKTLGVRKDLFTRTEPWVVDHLDETARYVRVRMTGTAYIALNEIEVYAP